MKEIKELKILSELLVYQDGILRVSKSFSLVGKDCTYINEIVSGVAIVLLKMSRLTDVGYVNNPRFDLPIFIWLLSRFNIDKQKSKTDYSVLLNTLYFNLFLILLLHLVIKIEKHCGVSDEYSDLCVDVTNIKRSIVRILNPVLRDKISNKGLSVLLNAIVGYDSEYELKSSLLKLNDLISTQLSGSTRLVLKIPIVNVDPVNPGDLKGVLKPSEKVLGSIACNSIDESLKDIRDLLYKENDIFIENLIDRISLIKDVKIVTAGGFKLFLFPHTEVKSSIKYTDVYYSKDLIIDSDSLLTNRHEKSLLNIIEWLNVVSGKEMSVELADSVKKCSNKSASRMTYRHGKLRLSITVNRVLYICMHESAADLSMLKDFDSFKENLDINARYFVTRGKPLSFDWCSSKVHFRDTSLLAPTGVKSLAGIGKIYGENFNKIDIGDYKINMRKLLKDDKVLFERYAIRDAIITWKHCITMEEFNFSIGKIGVPITLSSIGKSYVIKEWDSIRYKGYQPSSDMILGNISTILTPKGARSVKMCNFIVPFIEGYRGGRNECYMYGVDKDRVWIDYDLTSCYTTVMSILGDPDYDKATYIFNKTLETMSAKELLFNYVMVDVVFKFPNNIKYPCIPTRVDDDIDIYPLEGRSTITGCEYLVARSMGCKLHVKSGVIVPFKTEKINKTKPKTSLNYFGPLRGIVKELQRKRREHPKKTFYNYMYKEIGNSIYGQIAMGISGKKSFDIKTQTNTSVLGGVLSNPILASYITGFTRGLIGECLNNIQKLEGKILSTTTDGFITNIIDLEDKILALMNNDNKDSFVCFNLYREVRSYLTTFENTIQDTRALEVKNIEERGVISCKTRVQLGFTNGGILASTGFQTKGIEKSWLIDTFTRIMENDSNKVIEYIQNGLRSASDIYKNKGHVTRTYKDRVFSLEFDNKRCILNKQYSNKQVVSLLDSKPWMNVKECGKIRELKETVTKPVYVKGFITSMSKSYKSYIETSVRGFVKACLSNDVNKRLGIPLNYFNDYKSIIDFVYKFEPARVVKLSPSSISNLKYRNTITKTVPKTAENEAFIAYVKDNIEDFRSDLFFK